MNYRFDLEEEPLAAEAYAGFDGDEEFDAEPADWEWESEPTDEPEALDFEWDDLEWQGEINRRSRDYIRWVQRSLNQILGTRLVVDGIIGRQTRSAIRSFQQRQGLMVDGIVGSQTEAALIAAGAESPPLSRIPPRPQAPSRPIPIVPTGRGCRFRFTPRPVEVPGGGRIKDKTPPRSDDLVEVRGIGGRRIRLHRLAAEAWKALISAARSDGIPPPLLLPISGFRDPEHQRRLWERALKRYGSPQAARKWVAPPGSSPHQSGRAIDFHLGGKNSSGNVANLRRLPAYKWLVENAVCFGFYPYKAEPWHWEYNPPATAKEVGAFDTELTNLWQSEVNRNSPDYIRWVQHSLNQILGTRLAVDGIIGIQTRSAIRRFQRQRGLTVDGIVGSQTEAALMTAGAGSPPLLTTIPTTPPAINAITIRWSTRRTDSLEPGLGTVKTAPFKPDPGDPRDIVLAATAAAEGGYDTVNMYDRGILSWGIMQWTVHAGSLQRALAFIKNRLLELGQSALWQQLFPDLDIRRVGGEFQLLYRGTPVIGQEALRRLFRGRSERGAYEKNVIENWARVFARAGRHPLIQRLQREYARREIDRALNRNLSQLFGANYRRVRDYIGSDLKATTLFFGMWTNNPRQTYNHLKLTIDRLANRYGSYDIGRWPSGWQGALSAEFERVLRASRFGYWGDSKAREAGRTSRTQKILAQFNRLAGERELAEDKKIVTLA